MDCPSCKLDKNGKECIKCQAMQAFEKTKTYVMKHTGMKQELLVWFLLLIILIIVSVAMYMDYVPNPFKTQPKQHLQYFFF